MKVIEFPRQTVQFQPTREDMTVGEVVLPIHCSHPEKLRVNGLMPEPAWSRARISATGELVVEEFRGPEAGPLLMHIYLARIAANQFQLGPLTIEVSSNEPPDLLCLALKVWFNEVANQYDGLYYVNLDDRYALVSYCSHPSDSQVVRARFKQNRVATIDEFRDAFSKPFVIRLNQRALRPEWTPSAAP